MEEEMTDAQFEAGLRAVLGSHYQDLTKDSGPGIRRQKRRDRTWEWICWAAVYGAMFALAWFAC